MKCYVPFCMMLLMLCAGLSVAQANSIINDTFDTYVDGVGAPDQTAFQAVWSPIGTVAPISATVTQAQAASAANSIQIDASSTNGQQQNRQSFTETGALNIGDQLVWSFDFRESSFLGAPMRKYAILSDSAASNTNQIISLGTNNNQTAAQSGGNYYMARIVGYLPPATDPDGGSVNDVNGAAANNWFKLNDAAVGLRSVNAWNNLKVVITKDTAVGLDYYFYINGVLAETISDVGSAASTGVSWDRLTLGPALGNGGNGNYWFDNVKLDLNPFVATTGVEGDYNSNNFVDAADYVVWRQHNGETFQLDHEVTTPPTSPGQVMDDDYDAWRERFGNPPGSGSGLFVAGEVPEPTTDWLLVLGLAALANGRRRIR